MQTAMAIETMKRHGVAQCAVQHNGPLVEEVGQGKTWLVLQIF
jgi:hypothetical protein